MSSKPGAKTWVLRCKIHTTTVLLFAEPTTSLIVFKTELHKALLETSSNNSIQCEDGSIPVPGSIHDIILGKLIDPDNTKSGWERLEEEAEEQGNVKSKGKAVVGTGKLQNGASKITLQGAGLSDGALVGVKFRGSEGLLKPSIETKASTQEVWDIILPRLEESDLVVADSEDEGLPEMDAEPMTVPVPVRTKLNRAFNR